MSKNEGAYKRKTNILLVVAVVAIMLASPLVLLVGNEEKTDAAGPVFDVNYYTGTSGSLITTENYEVGSDVKVNFEIIPVNGTRVFLGWSDGSGNVYSSTGARMFNMPSSTVSLYAVWEDPKITGTTTITFAGAQNSAYVSGNNSVTVTGGNGSVCYLVIQGMNVGSGSISINVSSGTTVVIQAIGNNTITNNDRTVSNIYLSSTTTGVFEGRYGSVITVNKTNTLGSNQSIIAASIGGNASGAPGVIQIESGTISVDVQCATSRAAAIGGGDNGTGVARIIINGGVVNVSVTGSSNISSAGIGSGGKVSTSESTQQTTVIDINGGTVTSTLSGGTIDGAAIGTGARNSGSSNISVVNIKGGVVNANLTTGGTTYAAAIGSGSNSGAGRVNITDARVTVTSTVNVSESAGIGGGQYQAGIINITNSNVSVSIRTNANSAGNGSLGAGIGGGVRGDGTVTITNSNVNVDISARHNTISGAGIGGGAGEYGMLGVTNIAAGNGIVTMNNSVVNVKMEAGGNGNQHRAAAIGGGGQANGSGSGGSGGDGRITIIGGTITTSRVNVSSQGTSQDIGPGYTKALGANSWIKIDGGSIKVSSNNGLLPVDSAYVTTTSGARVHPNILAVRGLGSTYGSPDVQTLKSVLVSTGGAKYVNINVSAFHSGDNNLYVYLPNAVNYVSLEYNENGEVLFYNGPNGSGAGTTRTTNSGSKQINYPNVQKYYRVEYVLDPELIAVSDIVHVVSGGTFTQTLKADIATDFVAPSEIELTMGNVLQNDVYVRASNYMTGSITVSGVSGKIVVTAKAIQRLHYVETEDNLLNVGAGYYERTPGVGEMWNLGDIYIQIADIQMTVTTGHPNLVPIGGEYTPFYGIYEGNNYTIYDLIVISVYGAGLFGYVEGATITNVIIEDGSIESTGTYPAGGIVGQVGIMGNHTGPARVTTISGCVNNNSVSSSYISGGIVGLLASGTAVITDCVNTGDVSGSEVTGGIMGGIHGETPGIVLVATLEDNINYGNVRNVRDGGNSRAGGIIGWASAATNIEGNSNEGNVTAESATHYAYAGGIVGVLHGNVIYCDNRGIVTATNTGTSSSRAGGIVGISYGQIIDCDNYGAVSAEVSTTNNGSAVAGGIVGTLTPATGILTGVFYCNNYANVTSVGRNSGVGGIAGYASNTTIEGCVTGYGTYSNTHLIAEGTDTGYSYAGGIIGQSLNVDVLSCDIRLVTVEAHYGTSRAGGIIGLAQGGSVAGETESRCLVSGFIYAEGKTVAVGGVIGYTESTSVSFCEFEYGTIVAETNAGAGNSHAGGIAGVSYSTITDSENKAEVVRASGEQSFAGGIVGLTYGSISDCVNNGEQVSSQSLKTNGGLSYSGGIAGYLNNATVEGSINNSAIVASAFDGKGNSRAGGIVGYVNAGSSIETSYNHGNVTAINAANYAYSGGIAGISYGDIEGCDNYGVIEAQGKYSRAGGIAAYTLSGVSVSYSNNFTMVVAINPEGNTGGTASAGGIVGYSTGTSIVECDNSGAVAAMSSENKGNTRAGGISGYTDGGTSITDCENTNLASVLASCVTGYSYAGGIAGITYDSIIECENYGEVESTGMYCRAGGIAGYAPNAIIDDCLNDHDIEVNYGTNYKADGLIGYIEGTTITDSLSYGDIIVVRF